MRLFLALDLPDDLRGALAALRADVPGARWIPPENLHVTLHFLGEVASEIAEALAADMQQLVFTPVPLVTAGRDVFPDLRRPRVLVARFAHNLAFEALHAATAALIARHGFTLETRPFQPHVTLARLKNPDGTALRAIVQQSAELPEIVGQRVALYESVLDSSGARYRPLASAHASTG